MLSAAVSPDLVNGVILVELHGLLNLESATTLRAVLLKCLARGADTVLVDVADLRVETRSRLTVFPAALRGAPGASLVLCCARAELRALMHGRVLGDVTIYPDRAAALSAVTAAEVTGVQRMTSRIGASAAAPSQARQLVSAACREWGLEELREPASLVVSELVSNAVQHAGTDMVIRLARRGALLHLSVEDGSRRPPHAGGAAEDPGGQASIRGRGLHLVDMYTSAWGSDITGEGKTVWATLRAPNND